MNTKMLIPAIFLLAACSNDSSEESRNPDDPENVVAWAAPAQISSATISAALDVALAVDPDGNAMAVWTQYFFDEDSSWHQIAASHFVPNQGWNEAQTIHGVDANHYTGSPQVKFDANGNAIAIWFHATTNPAKGRVRVNHYTPSAGWGDAHTLHEFDSTTTIVPKLAVTPSGEAVAAWGDQNERTIWTNHYSPLTGWTDSVEIEESIGKAAAFSIDVAIDHAGNAIAVWQERENNMDLLPDVVASRYTPEDGWSIPERLEGSNDSDVFFPRIGLDSVGNGIALWQKYGETSQIYFNRYLADSGWTDPQLLATGYYPALAVSSNGSATAIWFAADNNLVAAVFSPATGWTNSSSIDANNNNVGYHRIAINDFGDAFAIWSQSDGSLDSIWANHYVSGEGWKGAKLVENRNLYSAYRPVIVVNNDNTAIAAWDEYTDSGNDVWASHYPE